jgi:tRNA pseudouridine38-40 synthase
LTGSQPEDSRDEPEDERFAPSPGTASHPANEKKFVIIVEYDGTNYHGFQLQVGANTIQAELEKAILALTGENRRVIPASRTDAGVHAVAQVVAFRTAVNFPPKVILNGLNHHLPPDIAVREAYRVKNTLNVRREAVSREYKYYILNRETRSPLRARYAFPVKGEIDLTAMNAACAILLGEHDFISFASALEAKHLGKTTRTILHAVVVREQEDVVVFEITANAFLTHQVRNTVGALLRVGQHKMQMTELNKILEAKRAGSAGPGVPARGLFLTKVNYPYSFEEVAE